MARIVLLEECRDFIEHCCCSISVDWYMCRTVFGTVLLKKTIVKRNRNSYVQRYFYVNGMETGLDSENGPEGQRETL